MGKIKELPSYERPREKAYKNGVESLSDSELLAIIIGSGIRNISALEVSMNLIFSLKGLSNVFNTSFYELCKHQGISKVKALSIIAIKELFVRYNKTNFDENDKIRIDSYFDVYNYLHLKVDNEEYEKEIVLYLNNKNELLYEQLVSIGNEFMAISNNRLICRVALEQNARRVIVTHNHPSGKAKPSNDDLLSFKALEGALEHVGVKLVDHIIIGKNEFYSIIQAKKYIL